MATSRILRNTGHTLEVTAYADGTATDADGAVTVTVKTADGATLSTGAATAPGSGVYRYSLAPQANLNFLTVTWAGAWGGVANTLTSHAELVGAHLVSEAQARAFDGSAMDSCSDAEIADARAQVTDMLQAHTGVSWVPRFRRHTLVSGPGGLVMVLPDTAVTAVLSASADDVAFTATELGDVAIQNRTLTSGGTYFQQAVTVEYEHGYAYPRDGVERVCLMWMRKLLVRSGMSDSAMSYSSDVGTISYAPFAPSGVREVDAWLASHRAVLGSA